MVELRCAAQATEATVEPAAMSVVILRRALDNPTFRVAFMQGVESGELIMEEFDQHFGEATPNTIQITKRMVRFTRKEPLNACPG